MLLENVDLTNTVIFECGEASAPWEPKRSPFQMVSMWLKSLESRISLAERGHLRVP